MEMTTVRSDGPFPRQGVPSRGRRKTELGVVDAPPRCRLCRFRRPRQRFCAWHVDSQLKNSPPVEVHTRPKCVLFGSVVEDVVVRRHHTTPRASQLLPTAILRPCLRSFPYTAILRRPARCAESNGVKCRRELVVNAIRRHSVVLLV